MTPLGSDTPVRIQRRRDKGWRMPPNTVYVGRASLWGNPWAAKEAPDWIIPGWDGTGSPEPGTARQRTPRERAAWAVAMYRREMTHWGLLGDWYASERLWEATNVAIRATGAENMGEAAIVLCGKNLACWCALDQPCHADVLLDLANRSAVLPSAVPESDRRRLGANDPAAGTAERTT